MKIIGGKKYVVIQIQSNIARDFIKNTITPAKL